MIKAPFAGAWRVITPKGALYSVIGLRIGPPGGRVTRSIELVRVDGEREKVYLELKTDDKALFDTYYSALRGAMSSDDPNEVIDLSVGIDSFSMRKESV